MRISSPLKKALFEYESKIPKFKVENGKTICSESGIILDKNGNQVCEMESGRTSTSVTIAADSIRHSVMTHNHPYPLPLSQPDMMMGLAANLKEMRAVDPISNRVYLMELPVGFDFSSLNFSKKAKCYASFVKYYFKFNKLEKKFGMKNINPEEIISDLMNNTNNIKNKADYFKEAAKINRILRKDLNRACSDIKFRTLVLDKRKS